MGELEEYVRAKLAEAMAPWAEGCFRCNGLELWMMDGRCGFCGMDPRDEGPAPIRIMRGIC